MADDPFKDFRFPDPIELPPLEPYEGVDANYGGYEPVWGGEEGMLPRLLLNPDDGDGGGGDGERRAFQPYGIEEDTTGVWRCYVSPGLVLDNHILNMGYLFEDSEENESGKDAIRVRIPTVGGELLIDPKCDPGASDWVQPRLDIAHPAEHVYIYCVFNVNDHGQIIEEDSSGISPPGEGPRTVWIESFTEAQLSVNHIPPSPGGSQRDGKYYWLLAEICMDSSGAGTPLVIHRHESNIIWQGEFQLENDSADGSRIYRVFAKNRGEWMLRRIKGCYGIRDVESGKQILIHFDGENVGVYSGSGGAASAEVYVDSADESCGAKAKFRRITPTTLFNPPEIFTVQNGNTVEIRGNGKTGSITFLDCDSATQATVAWRDGLITTTGNQFFKAGCDSSGQSFSGTDNDFIAEHQNGGSNLVLITFTNGVAKAVTNVKIRTFTVCTDSSGEQTYDFLTTN